MTSKNLISFENRNKSRNKMGQGKVTSPLKVTGRINQAEQQYHVSKAGNTCRHYSFSQSDEKQAPNGRRRYSEKYVPGSAAHSFRKKFARFANRERIKKIILPTKFLLGGNFRDPLNLNSLSDETVNRMLNAVTPVSSPLPVRPHKADEKLPVKIPKNIHDPLNLDGGENSDVLTLSPKVRARKRKYTYKKHNRMTAEKTDGVEAFTGGKLLKPLTVEVEMKEEHGKVKEIRESADFSMKQIADKIVSPVIPQMSPKWKRRRTVSEGRSESKVVLPRALLIEEDPRPAKIEKPVVARAKSKRNSMQHSTQVKFKIKNERYAYGNYNLYCGYRNTDYEEDRLVGLPKDMFKGKEVLDIGCNVGHVTLAVARQYAPRRIVGLDADGHLVAAANKNILHFMSQDLYLKTFPTSMGIEYGPLASHPLLAEDTNEEGKFPHNIEFQMGNYVPSSDAEVDLQQPEFDVILAFGITKYIHLNYGDDGLKRAFRRIFRQLRPGGKLILQAQPWGSYRKKKKLTEAIFRVFKSIQFRPDQFKDYLLSPEVGFSDCNVVAHRLKGFQQSIVELTKPKEHEHHLGSILNATCDSFQRSNPWTPFPCSFSTGHTENSCSSTSPHFEIGSSQFTPCSTCQDTPSYLNQPWSQPGTPWTETTCSSFEEMHPRDPVDAHQRCPQMLAEGVNCDQTCDLSDSDSGGISGSEEFGEGGGTSSESLRTLEDSVRTVDDGSRTLEDGERMTGDISRTVEDGGRTCEDSSHGKNES